MKSYTGRDFERDSHKHKHNHQDMLDRGQRAHHHTDSWLIILLIAVPVLIILAILIYALITR